MLLYIDIYNQHLVAFAIEASSQKPNINYILQLQSIIMRFQCYATPYMLQAVSR